MKWKNCRAALFPLSRRLGICLAQSRGDSGESNGSTAAPPFFPLSRRAA
jgi:hypothetical protein